MIQAFFLASLLGRNIIAWAHVDNHTTSPPAVPTITSSSCSSTAVQNGTLFTPRVEEGKASLFVPPEGKLSHGNTSVRHHDGKADNTTSNSTFIEPIVVLALTADSLAVPKGSQPPRPFRLGSEKTSTSLPASQPTDKPRPNLLPSVTPSVRPPPPAPGVVISTLGQPITTATLAGPAPLPTAATSVQVQIPAAETKSKPAERPYAVLPYVPGDDAIETDSTPAAAGTSDSVAPSAGANSIPSPAGTSNSVSPSAGGTKPKVYGSVMPVAGVWTSGMGAEATGSATGSGESTLLTGISATSPAGNSTAPSSTPPLQYTGLASAGGMKRLSLFASLLCGLVLF